MKPLAPESADPSRAVQSKFGGLLVRRSVWKLSWRGKLALLLVAIVSVLIIQRNLYAFLTPTQRVASDYLVVEGWIAVDCLQQATVEFTNGHYRKLLTSGCTVNNPWNPDAKVTSADWGASRLRRIGFDTNAVEAVPCWASASDRTYQSALAVKKWFSEQHLPLRSLNVVTEGSHARRTRLLFQKALGSDVDVGIIAFEPRSADMKHWWRSSEGTREVTGECIAYLYARFFFRPDQ
ncbi:MAG: YdcF family protein [Akkermansiaceae bacterium]|nr:YdcF family protein [Verrucomicrobiales bacterium]